jgi:glutamyl-tRNA reductase
MSRLVASRALHRRFESIRRAEIQRLSRKLRCLTEKERDVVESITADLIRAIAIVPQRMLGTGPNPAEVDEALIQLFGL